MPDLDVLITNWEKLGGSFWGYDQSAYLKKNGTVTTYGGVNATDQKWEKPVTRDVSKGICHALSLRFVEGRMVGLDERAVWLMLKGSFEISKIQQAMAFEQKSGYMAGGVKGKTRSGSILRPVNSRQELVDLLVGSPGLYVYSMWSEVDGSGHSVAFDSRDQQFWFFDANSGMFVAPRKSTLTSDKSILLSFIYGYWEWAKYKQDFHKGRREITKYKS